MEFTIVGLIFGGFLVFFIGIIFFGLDITIVPMIIGIVMMALGFLAFIFAGVHAGNKNIQKMNEDWAKERTMKFYKHCLKEGVKELSELDKKGKFEKAKLIAEQFSIEPEQIKTRYSEGKFYCEEYENKKNEDKLFQLKQKEDELRTKLTKYSDFRGREKTLAILNDMAEPLKQQISDNYKSMDNSCSTSGYQKQHDWAIHGGIASAIGGPVAGAMAALDVQSKNQQIKAQNDALFALKSMTYSLSKQEVEKLQPKLDKIYKKISAVKTKLVLEVEKEKLFECLECTAETCVISKTGCFEIKAAISQVKTVPIYENNNTIIDGTILASMYQNDTLVGQAKLVLPLEGSINAKVTGISEGNADCDKDFKIIFEPYDLWVIEK